MLQHEVTNYPGMPSHPFTWADVVDKFDRLTAGNLSTQLGNEIKDVVQNIGDHQEVDLQKLLSAIPYPN